MKYTKENVEKKLGRSVHTTPNGDMIMTPDEFRSLIAIRPREIFFGILAVILLAVALAEAAKWVFAALQ